MIYLAHDPIIDRKVAIKLIRADLLSSEERADYLTRFRREAHTAGRCAHGNIVSIYDLSVQGAAVEATLARRWMPAGGRSSAANSATAFANARYGC